MAQIIFGGGTTSTPATASVNATANQTTLGTVTLGLTASAAPSAYAWEVNGSTTGLSSSTAAAPTFTPTQPGTYTVTCTPTINGGPVIAEPDTFLVGDGLPRVRTAAGAARITYS
jgi:PKD repeat protein